METVYQPTIAYEPYQYVETVPIVQEAYEPVQVIEQVARPASFNAFEPVIPQIKAKVIEEKFNIGPVYEQVAPAYEPVVYEQFAQAVPVIEQPIATVVDTVVQPQVEVIQPVEVIAPVAVQVQPVVQPVVEYEAVFFEAPSCGVPNYPTYSAPVSCSGNGLGGLSGLGGFGGFGGFGGYGNY